MTMKFRDIRKIRLIKNRNVVYIFLLVKKKKVLAQTLNLSSEKFMTIIIYFLTTLDRCTLCNY